MHLDTHGQTGMINEESMKEIREQWKKGIFEGLQAAARRKKIDPELITLDQVISETPPNPELGDLAFPMFPFSRHFKCPPPAVGGLVMEVLDAEKLSGAVHAAGPYLNVIFSKAEVAAAIINDVLDSGDSYGENRTLSGRKVMVEFSCPNTNKPLHLGHLRNDALGESLANILAANGAEVLKAILVNDRGIHICKSMVAYKKFGDGRTPESEGAKGDHFVGDYYVKYNQWEAEDGSAEEHAREALLLWEAGDPDTVDLWKKMNAWTMSGIEETYSRTGISFDRYYYESETYTYGREVVRNGVDSDVFYAQEDGSVWVNLADVGLDKKILLRSDGTSVYITQDIGTAIKRHEDWPFDRLIYVVGAEQEYHFKVLFHILDRLKYEWASNLFHFSYGMVNLPDGKMKSREGTVVDADDLLDLLSELARDEIIEKDRVAEVDDLDATAEAIARAAVNYYLLQVSPAKDMVFNPDESISFNGNTGPYLQYTGARLSSMLRKFEEREDEYALGAVDTSLVEEGDEWEVVKLVGVYPDVVEGAGREQNPTAVANHLYALAKRYSRYYHDNPVLHNENPSLVHTRIAIARGVIQVLKNGFRLIGIPFLDRM